MKRNDVFSCHVDVVHKNAVIFHGPLCGCGLCLNIASWLWRPTAAYSIRIICLSFRTSRDRRT